MTDNQILFYEGHEDLCSMIYTVWLDFINEETDPDKLQELAKDYMDLLRNCIENDNGHLKTRED